MAKNEKGLTEKQERFCREYLLCGGNASEAYRRAFDAKKMKPETIWSNACRLLADNKVTARIEELREDIETTLGINKTTLINDFRRVFGQSMEPVPVLEWQTVEVEYVDKNGKTRKRKQKELVQKRNSEGELVWQFDSSGANNALDKIMKALGYYAPEKSQFIGKDGKPVDPNNTVIVKIE